MNRQHRRHCAPEPPRDRGDFDRLVFPQLQRPKIHIARLLNPPVENHGRRERLGIGGRRVVRFLLQKFGKVGNVEHDRIGILISKFRVEHQRVRRVRGHEHFERGLWQRLSGERELQGFAALPAERIHRVDPRPVRDREPVHVVLQAAEIQVVDAQAILPVHRGAKHHLRIRALRGVGLGDFPAARIDQHQPRQQRRAEALRLDAARELLSGLRGECPHVNILARKNPAIDRHRRFDLHGNRLALKLALDHLGQRADDEFHRGRRALRGPRAPRARAGRGLRGELHLARVIARIILLRLRRRLRNHRPLEPQRVRLDNARRSGHARPEHFEARVAVQVQPAHLKFHRRPPLPARGKNVRNSRLLGAQAGVRETESEEKESAWFHGKFVCAERSPRRRGFRVLPDRSRLSGDFFGGANCLDGWRHRLALACRPTQINEVARTLLLFRVNSTAHRMKVMAVFRGERIFDGPNLRDGIVG